MEKYTHYVIAVEDIATSNRWAYAERVHNASNLLCAFKQPEGIKILHINACDSRKESLKVAEDWNDCYKKQNAKNNSKWYKTSDGWFTFFVNTKTGEKKLHLEADDIEVSRCVNSSGQTEWKEVV